jgi:hypothetical protein
MKKMTFTDFLLQIEYSGFEWDEIECCVLRKGCHKKEKGIRELLGKGESPSDIERFTNHHHMSHFIELFGGKNNRSTRKMATELYQAVAEYRLKRAFPDREFVFEVSDDGDDTIVTHYQKQQSSHGEPEDS